MTVVRQNILSTIILKDDTFQWKCRIAPSNTINMLGPKIMQQPSYLKSDDIFSCFYNRTYLCFVIVLNNGRFFKRLIIELKENHRKLAFLHEIFILIINLSLAVIYFLNIISCKCWPRPPFRWSIRKVEISPIASSMLAVKTAILRIPKENILGASYRLILASN